MRAFNALYFTLILGALGAVPATAQQSLGLNDGRTLSYSAMDAAVAGHTSAVGEQRGELAELLSHPQVRNVALARGIDMGRIESVAAGLSDDQMNGVAPLVAGIAPLVQDGGGLGTVTIGVGAAIIILLVLILVTN
jgi:hypothetical protein